MILFIGEWQQLPTDGGIIWPPPTNGYFPTPTSGPDPTPLPTPGSTPTPDPTPLPTPDPTPTPPPTVYHPSGLPMLSMSMANAGMGDGFGMQAFSTTDLAFIIGNPPRVEGMQLETLPVFRSPLRIAAPYHRPLPLDTTDTTAMFAEIERIAAILGLSMDDADEIVFYTIRDHHRYWADFMRNPNILDEELGENSADLVISATVYWGDISIEATNTDLVHEITIHIPIDDFPMPPGINERFEHYFTSYNVTDEQALRMTAYFLTNFAQLVDFDSPAIEITSGYIFPPEEFMRIFFWYSFSAYESNGDYVEQVLGYNFNRVHFVSGMEWEWDDPTSESGIQRRVTPASVRLTRPDFMLSQKIGDYPIITLEEARQLLLEGQYISTVFTDLVMTEELIAHVDLVYLTHWQEIFMPFYRFYVELPPWNDVFERYAEDYGMATYGWFFVPAVRSEFFTDWQIYIHFQ